MHQQTIYLTGVFQTIKLKFLDALDYKQNNSSSVSDEGTDGPNSQKKKSKRTVLSGCGEIFSSILYYESLRAIGQMQPLII